MEKGRAFHNRAYAREFRAKREFPQAEFIFAAQVK